MLGGGKLMRAEYEGATVYYGNTPISADFWGAKGNPKKGQAPLSHLVPPISSSVPGTH